MDMKENRKHFSKIGLGMFFGTLIICAAQIICQSVVVLLRPEWGYNQDILLASTMIPLYLIGYPLTFLLVKRAKGGRIEEHPMTKVQLVKAFAICYVLLIAGNILGLTVTMLIGILKGGEVLNPFVTMATTGNMWITAVYVVILAPVFEEYLFRKLLIDRTIKYGEGVAIVVSAIMFALFHGNLNQFVYALPMGLFLAFIYVKTGRMKYTLVLHMAVNFMGSVIGNIISTYFDMEKMPGMIAVILFNVLIIAVIVAGLIFLIKGRKQFKLTQGETALEKGTKFKTIWFNVGMVLYCAFWGVNIIVMLFV